MLQGHGRANRHFIVIGHDGIELRARQQPVAGQVHALAALPFGALLLDHLDTGKVLEHLFGALGTVMGGVLCKVAHDDRHIALAAEFFRQVAHLQLPGLDVVGGHGDHAFGQGTFVRVAIDVHQRRLGRHGGTGHVGGGGGVHRQHDHCVDLLVEEALDLIKLAHHVALGVFELDLHILLLGGRFQAGAHVGHEVVVDPGNAHADAISREGPLAEQQQQGGSKQRIAIHKGDPFIVIG